MIRTTRQNIEVLGDSDTSLRTTQQNIEVLRDSDTSVRVSRQIIEYLTEYATFFISSNISFNQVIGLDVVYSRAGEQGLFITQFIDVAGANYLEDIEHWFGWGTWGYDPDTGEFYPIYYGLQDEIDLDIIRNREKIQDFIITQKIEYIHDKASGTSKSVSNNLSLNQVIGVGYGIEQNLTFTQTISAEVAYGLSNTLEFNQIIEVEGYYNISVNNNLELQSTITYIHNKFRVNVLCNYSPFVGSTTDSNAPYPPSSSPPTLISLQEVTLTSDYSSITLRNPEFGNRDRLSFQRINRETRGGTLIIYADSTWPRTQQIILEFTGLSESKAQEFLTFVAYSIGQNIELKDWENQEWGGIITSPQNPVVRDGECNISISLEIEGGRLYKQSIISNLDTLDQLVRAIMAGRILISQLVISQIIDRNIFVNRSLISTITIDQDIDRDIIANRSLTSTITINQDIDNYTIRPRSLISIITIDQDIDRNIIVNRSLISTITINQDIDRNIIVNRPLTSIITINHSNIVAYSNNNTPWTGDSDKKLYLQSGQFTSTLKTSYYIGGTDNNPQGISWDGTNTPWIGYQTDKLYLQSGQFTSTLKTSESITLIETVPSDISYDGINTPWTGFTGKKLYLQSGQFTSTLKTSYYVESIDTYSKGISFDGSNTPWCGSANYKLYLQSGQFNSTLKTSYCVGGIDTVPSSISWDSFNTPWGGKFNAKLYLQSGQFTSTLKTSEAIGAIDTAIRGIDTNQIFKRLN